MSTNDKTDGSTGSLAELFHLVGQLVPEGQRLVTAPPNMTVAEALRLMSDHNFSQLPVVAGKAVLGVFSYRSLAQRLLGMRQMPEDVGNLPVDEFAEQFQFVQPLDNWESILKHLDREDGVLVGHRELLRGILTPMDVLGYLHRIASPFVMLAEIELSLRRIITACVNEEELRICIRNSLAQKYDEEGLPIDLSEMTFADYVQIIGDGRNWPHFVTVFGEGEWQRKTTAGRLRQAGELRNEVFHFRREMGSQDLEILSALRDWLQMKARAFEGVKAEKAVPGELEEAKLPATERPIRTKWDEPSFFEALGQRRGPEETVAARKLFEWANRRGLFFRWGTGVQAGSCIAAFGEEHGPTMLVLWTSGDVRIPLAWIARLSPFDQEEHRLRLLDRLNAMKRVHIPSAAATTDQGVPLSVLSEDDNLRQFMGTMDWVVDEIERASAAGAWDLVPLEVAEALDPAAAERLQQFLSSLLGIGFIKEEGSSQDAYKATLLYKFREWDEHRAHPVTVLYLTKEGQPSLRFRIDMLSVVQDLDVEELQARLLAAGCNRTNRKTTPIELVLSKRNDQATFDRLSEILEDLMRKHRVV